MSSLAEPAKQAATPIVVGGRPTHSVAQGAVPPVGSELTTYRALEFFPERVSGPTYVGERLAGEPFVVPPRTRGQVVAAFNGRALMKVSSPGVGFRYVRRDEYTEVGEAAPPEARRKPVDEKAADEAA